MKNIECIKQK